MSLFNAIKKLPNTGEGMKREGKKKKCATGV